MHTCCVISVEVRTDESPILCAKADKAVGGGGCKEAQTSGSMGAVGISLTKSSSFGGNFGRCAVEREDASFAAVDANRLCACPICSSSFELDFLVFGDTEWIFFHARSRLMAPILALCLQQLASFSLPDRAP